MSRVKRRAFILEIYVVDRKFYYGERGVFMILNSWRQYFTPQSAALFGSLLLSLISYLGVVTIGKDGAYYVDVAQTIAEQGVAAGVSRFHWVGFPLLLAVSHKVTGLPIEGLSYVICALFISGTCTLLVDLVSRRFQSSAWWAVLVVLAIPALNEFRSDIIREHGFWFFSVLSLWLSVGWREHGRWWMAAAIQVAIAAAAIFRLEALLLEGVFALWLLPGLRTRAGWLRLLQLFWLPLVLACVLWGTLPILNWQRVQYFLSMLDPAQVNRGFQAIASQFAESLRYKYSRDDAGLVVFFGVCGLILVKFLKLLGPFVLPLLTTGGRVGVERAVSRYQVFMWAWLAYFLVLLLFFFHEQFVNSRYVSFLNLLAVPFIAVSASIFSERYRFCGRFLLVVALLVMIGGVVSLSPKKTHYIEAGHWMAEHYEKTNAVFYDDPRIGYYAGWGYSDGQNKSVRDLSEDALKEYLLFVLEVEPDEAWLQEWLDQNNLVRVALFDNSKGDFVQIFTHKEVL